MYSKRLYCLISHLAKVSSKLGGSPLTYDSEVRTFSVSKDIASTRRFRISYNSLLLWLIMFVPIIQKCGSNGNMDMYYLTLAYFTAACLNLVCCSILRFAPHDYCVLVNSSQIFFQRFQCTYMPDFDPQSNILNTFVDVVMIISGACWAMYAVMTTLLCLYDPRGVIFVGFLVPDHLYSWFPFGILTVIFHANICLFLALNLWLTSGLLVVYLTYFTILFTNELRLNNHKYRTKDVLRKSANLRHAYRSFQILQESALGFMGPVLYTSQFGFLFSPMVSNFVLIRHWNDLKLLSKMPLIVGSPSAILIWTLVLQFGKYLFTRSQKILFSWKKFGKWENRKESKIMMKFRKSCRPVLVCMGKQYQMKRMTQFKYVNGILRGTFKALLASTG